MLKDVNHNFAKCKNGFFYFQQDLEYTLNAQILDICQQYHHDLLLSHLFLHMLFKKSHI